MFSGGCSFLYLNCRRSSLISSDFCGGLLVLTALSGGDSFSYMMGGIECLKGIWVMGATLGIIRGKGWSLVGNESSY